MRISTIVLMILMSSMSFAQNAPINFETGGHGASWTWTVFENATNPALEIIANPDQTGINTSATVAKFTALQAGQSYAGVESAHGSTNLGPFVLDATNSTIKIMVWKTVISDVGIKLVAATGWSQGEVKVANTKVNQWEELTFSFASFQNPPAAEGQLDQIVIFPDFATRTQDNIVYFDNITFHPSTAPPAEPTTAAPTPLRPAADVISLFSNAYTNVTVDTWRTPWSAAILEDITIEGNATKKYTNLDIVGIETVVSQLDITGMTHFHLDVWSPNFTSLGVKLVDFGADGTYGGGDDKEHQINFTTPAQGQWVSLDIPLSEFTGLTTRSNIAQLIFVGIPTATTTLFVDNVYFYKLVPEGPNAPIDFETGGNGASWTWNVFENSTNPALEIITNPDQTGINTSATVAKFTALQAGQAYAGVESAHGSTNLGPFVLDATNNTIKIMVWKPVISDVGIKLVAASGWSQGEVKVANTKVNQWEELTFSFASFQNPPEAEGKYDQIVIFPDFVARTQDNIVYFDNITFNQGVITPTGPATPAPTPTKAAADVISLFSNAYTNVTVDTWRTSWSSAILEDITIEGNATKKYSNLDFVGIETVANQLNISDMTHVHIDVWSANFTFFGVKLVDFGANGAFGGGDDKEHQVNFTTPAQGQWVSLDIPLSDFTGLTTKSNLAQYILVGQPTGTATVYIDNFYFYKDGTTSVNTEEIYDMIPYPNPVRSGGQVQLSSNVKKVDLFDVNGKLIKSLNSTSVIGTDGLNKGMYIMIIHTIDGKVRSQRLIVN